MSWAQVIIAAIVLIFIAALVWPTPREGFTGSPAEIHKSSKPLFDETGGAATFSAFKTVVEPALSGGQMVDAEIHKLTQNKYNENPQA